mgnify:CR=1 FL=1|jgi:hypothetical protein
MKSQIYSFITGALTGLALTLYVLIWTTATGDGSTWDSGLGIALVVAIIALVGTFVARDYIKEDVHNAGNN